MANVEYLTVGRALGAHGRKGAVRVKILTDFPERFNSGEKLFIEGTPYTIESSSLTGDSASISFRGIDSPESAEALRGKNLEIPADSLNKLPPGRYYHHDILGLDVFTTVGAYLGKVTDILNTGGNDVYVVKNGEEEVLIPAVKDVVKNIDLAGKRITIEEIEGLLG
jgi:16S rRNA processing protein RimM